MPSSILTPNSLVFDGATYLYNIGPANQGGGLNVYLQSPSPYGLISFWYWTDSPGLPGAGKDRTILKMNPATGFAGGKVKVFFRRAANESTPRLFVRVQAASGAFVQFRTAPVPYTDRLYHHVLLRWNVSVNPNTLPDCYLDGKPLTWAIETRSGAATFVVEYKLNQNFYIGTDGELLGTASKEGPFRGILAEIFFDPIMNDFGVGVGSGGDALVYTFYDSKKSKYAFRPGRIGPDGSTVLKRKPAIYLHGYYNEFLANHRGASSFRYVGTLLSPDGSIADPFWWGFWRNVKDFFTTGAIEPYEFETPTGTGSGPRDNGGKRASLFSVPTTLAASSSEVKPAIANSPTGLISFWFNGANNNSGDYSELLFSAGLRKPHGQNQGYYFGLGVELGNPARGGVLAVHATNMTQPGTGGEIDGSNATAAFSFVALTQSPPFDGNWHHVIVAWNTTTPACRAFVDGVEVTMTDIWAGAEYVTHQWAEIPFASAEYDFYVGQEPTASEQANPNAIQKKHLSEFYISLANHDFVAALTPTLVGRFRHSGTGTALELGVTATLPFGADGPRPDFYLSGPPREFVNSFAKTDGTLGHRWGANGADADTTFRMRVIGGPLEPPETDPFRAKELIS